MVEDLTDFHCRAGVRVVGFGQMFEACYMPQRADSIAAYEISYLIEAGELVIFVRGACVHRCCVH